MCPVLMKEAVPAPGRRRRRRGPLVAALVLALATAAGVMMKAQAERAAAANPVRIISVDELRSAMKGHRGRVLVLHLWATWCLPCLQELPLVGALAREGPSRGVDLLSVSLDDPSPGSAAAVARVLSERGSVAMTRNILRVDNPEALVASIDPHWEGAIPAFFAYDRQGKLRHAEVGEMTRDGFDQMVRDLLTPSTVKK
jgi:thiol-disulfide isomerase/thioredoxin